jgi:hypothetical protein
MPRFGMTILWGTFKLPHYREPLKIRAFDRIWYTVAFRSLRNLRLRSFPGPVSRIEAEAL